MKKKLVTGGGIALTFFCIAIIFTLNSSVNIDAAQASVTPQISSRSYPSFGQTKTVQSTVNAVTPATLNQLKSFANSNTSTTLVAGRDYVEGDIIVKYKKTKINLETSAGQTQANSFNSNKKMEKREFLKKGNLSFLKIKDGKTTQQKITELQADPNVEYAEPNYLRHPNTINTTDTYKDLLWGLDNTGQTVGGTFPNSNPHTGTPDADIDAPEAWAIAESATTTPVIVAIIDNGVAYNHPDLADNMWDGTSCKDENGNSLGGCLHGYDYYDNDKDPLPEPFGIGSADMSSHATHVAGIVAAIKNNSRGVIGVAPQTKIMSLRFGLDVVGEVKAIDFAIQNGAKVINASFGGSTYSEAERSAIDRFLIAGGIFVTSAGNDAQSNDLVYDYPSGYDLANIISVAATDATDQLASFSNYGATAVDVGAPGTNIYSTIAEVEVLNEDFEAVATSSFPSGWTLGGTNNQWKVYDTGEAAWGQVLHTVRPSYPYAANASTTITSATYDFGTDVQAATLSFYVGCDTEYGDLRNADYLAVEYSADGVNFYPGTYPWYNGVFRIDEPFLDWLNEDDSSTGGAVAYLDNITIPEQYLTGKFKFRFRWVTNSTANNYGGCYVDDIKIKKFTDGSNEPYGYLSGTSMAAPHVAGLVALLEGYNPSLSASQIKNIILTSGDDLTALHGITSAGTRVNAKKAIQAVQALGQPKKINSFSFPDLSTVAIIDELNHTVKATVPYGTNLAALTPAIEFYGASINPNDGQVQDFTNPVIYTVTAADEATQAYTVTISISRSYIIDGSDAIDVIGQYQDVITNPALTTFERGNSDNRGINRLGLSVPSELALDAVHHRLFVVDGGSTGRILIYNLNTDNSLADYVPDNILGQTNYSTSTTGRSQNRFNTVYGLAYDSNGDRLFVSDYNNARVLVFDTQVIINGEAAVNVLGQANFTDYDHSTTSASTLYSPRGLAYDAVSNRLFAVDTIRNRVLVFNVATSTIVNRESASYVLGQANFNSGTAGTTSSTLSSPHTLQYDPINSRLFVIDYSNQRIMVFNVATSTITSGESASYVLGQSNFSTTATGHTQSTINSPAGLAYDTINNRLFVADKSNNRVLLFNVATSSIANGQSANKVLGQTDFTAVTSTVSQNGLNSPAGLAYNNGNNQLFVADQANNRVVIYDATTTPPIVNGHNALDVLGQFQDVTVSPLVPSFSRSTAYNYDYSVISKYGFSQPRFVTADPVHHRLFVADSYNNRVLVYNLNTDGSLADYTPIHVLGQPSFTTTTANTTTPSSLVVPEGLAYDFTRNYLFVNDGGNSRVMVFDVAEITDGEPAVYVLGQLDFVTNAREWSQTQFDDASSLVYDFVHQRLFIGNYSRVMVFDVAEIVNGEPAVNVLGQANYTSDAASTSQTGFDYIYDLAYDWVNDRLFVADYNNSRVLVFDVTEIINNEPAINVLGQANYSTKTQATTNGGFKNVSGLAYDNGSERLFVTESLFVAEGGNNRVTVFDVNTISNGEPAISVIGKDNYLTTNSGTTAKLLNYPRGSYYDENSNRLFVADTLNHRIMVYAVGQTNVVHPVALSYYPQNEATTTAVATNLRLRFSQPVIPGSGNITIYNKTTDLPLETIAVNSVAVNCSSTGLVTVTLADNLKEQTAYYVKIDATALVGAGYTENSYLGIDDATTWSFTTNDLTGPVLSNVAPAGVQEYGTVSVKLAATTNENANCRYSLSSGVGWASMTPFELTGAINHETPISSLTNGSSYTYYIVCQDLANNTSTVAVASFSVAVPVVVPPVTGGGNSGGGFIPPLVVSSTTAVSSTPVVSSTVTSLPGNGGGKSVITPNTLGQIIKVNAKNRPAVYYVSDGKKYLFVNRDTYTTWSNAIGDTGNRFATLQAITQAEFDAIPTGGNLIAKAGNLIKFDDSSIVYAVGSDGKLYKLIDLMAQTALYGKAVPYVIQSGFRDDYYNHGNSFSTLTASSVKPE